MIRRRPRIVLLAFCAIACSVTIIVLVPFVTVGRVEQVLLQLTCCVALFASGFVLGVKMGQ